VPTIESKLIDVAAEIHFGCSRDVVCSKLKRLGLHRAHAPLTAHPVIIAPPKRPDPPCQHRPPRVNRRPPTHPPPRAPSLSIPLA
jgi:hypothetical protein